jgi:hypothetical protein
MGWQILAGESMFETEPLQPEAPVWQGKVA